MTRGLTRCVALYCRISKDKNGKVEGVRAQEAWGRAYAAKHWPGVPVKLFSDNGKSGFDDDTVRPEYEALRKAIQRGEVAHLWSVEQSRLQRDETRWFELAAELDAAGLHELHTDRDGVVRVRDEVAGIKAVLNAAEVRKMLRRQADSFRSRAARGLPSGATPFGYKHGLDEKGERTYLVIESQARIVRECAQRVLSGWSLAAIAADLEARGIHGPRRVKIRDENGEVVTADGTPEDEGGTAVTRLSRVTHKTVKSWITNAAVAGIRVDQEVEIGAGNWTGILTVAERRAIIHKLSSPRIIERADGKTQPFDPTAKRATPRKYLLTGGIATCGKCGRPLEGAPKEMRKKLKDGTWQKTNVLVFYLCKASSCVGIQAKALDGYVTAKMFEALDDPAFVGLFTADENADQRQRIDEELSEIEKQRVELAKMWRLPAGDPNKLTTIEWQSLRRGLAEDEQRLRVEYAQIPQPPADMDFANIRSRWPDMPLEEKREVISTVIEVVTVHSAKDIGSRGVDDRRVVIGWRLPR